VVRADQSHAFEVISCRNDRLTPAEAVRLRRTNALERRAVFEDIKAYKLTDHSANARGVGQLRIVRAISQVRADACDIRDIL
jgi:hypothetical protein